MTSTDTIYGFTFTVPAAGDFFAHRSPVNWLEDLARFASITLTATETDDDPHRVTVIGTEDALRFSCCAFNLQAEQTPWDSTPVEQGEALEAVLASSGLPTDAEILAALGAVGIDAYVAYPSRIQVPLGEGDDNLLLTTEFNREDGGWEAVRDDEGAQIGLEDGPGQFAAVEDIVTWVQSLLVAVDSL